MENGSIHQPFAGSSAESLDALQVQLGRMRELICYLLVEESTAADGIVGFQ